MKRDVRTRLPVAQVLALVVLVALACEPERVTPLYAEGFEELCDGTPCGWQRSVGTPDQATWVETIHPGEHGLRLTGMVTVRNMEGGEMLSTGGSLFAQVTARCDRGSFLSTEIVINDTSGSRVHEQTISTTPDWQTSTFSILAGDPLFNARIVALVLTKTGSGACEISDLVIDDQTLMRDGC